MKQLRLISLLIVLAACTFTLFSGQLVSATASSNPLDSTCSAPGASDTAFCKTQPDGTTNPVGGPSGVLAKIINLVLIGAGVAAVIMIIVGGFEYVISTGDAQKVNTAKNTIIYALIGLLIAIFAELILKFAVRSL